VARRHVRWAFRGRCKTSYRPDDPARTSQGRPSRTTLKTLKGAFAAPAESVALERLHAVAQPVDHREDKAHERIGPRSGVPGPAAQCLKEDKPKAAANRDFSGPSYPSLSGAATIYGDGWPAGPNPRSRSSNRGESQGSVRARRITKRRVRDNDGEHRKRRGWREAQRHVGP